jgi:hypothetical protein
MKKYEGKGGMIMNEIYNEKYKILSSFSENEYQKVFTGEDLEDEQSIVVIHEFMKNDVITKQQLDNLASVLKNVVSTENTDDKYVIITDYKSGISITNYLNSLNGNSDSRLKLAKSYFETILNYEIVSNHFKYLLVCDSQMVVANDEIACNELLVMDNAKDLDLPFEDVANRIFLALEKILSLDKITYENSYSLKSFVHYLGSNDLKVNTIAEITSLYNDAVKGNFIPPEDEEVASELVSPIVGNYNSSNISDNNEELSSTDSENDDLDISSIEDEDPAEVEPSPINEVNEDIMTQREVPLENVSYIVNEPDDNDKGHSKKGIIAIILIILMAILGFFGYKAYQKNAIPAPIAKFSVEQTAKGYIFTNTSEVFGDDNEIVETSWIITKDNDELYKSDHKDIAIKLKIYGEYQVSLKVKDKYKWSELTTQIVEHAEDITTKEDVTDETLENDKISLITTNATFDEDDKHTGTKSVKFDLTKNEGSGSISLDDVAINGNITISMWVKSLENKNVKIELLGYRGNTLAFNKVLNHQPSSAGVWEMVNTNVTTKNVDKLKIKVTSLGNTVWLDDFEMNSFK